MGRIPCPFLLPLLLALCYVRGVFRRRSVQKLELRRALKIFSKKLCLGIALFSINHLIDKNLFPRSCGATEQNC